MSSRAKKPSLLKSRETERDAGDSWRTNRGALSLGGPGGLICNDEGKLLRLPLNRMLEDYDVIAGNFFICGIEGDEFVSLSDPLMIKYQKKFRYPELIGNSPMGLFAQKCSEQTYQRIQEELKHPPERPKDKSAPER